MHTRATAGPSAMDFRTCEASDFAQIILSPVTNLGDPASVNCFFGVSTCPRRNPSPRRGIPSGAPLDARRIATWARRNVVCSTRTTRRAHAIHSAGRRPHLWHTCRGRGLIRPLSLKKPQGSFQSHSCSQSKVVQSIFDVPSGEDKGALVLCPFSLNMHAQHVPKLLDGA
jgi:hypothetical protein